MSMQVGPQTYYPPSVPYVVGRFYLCDYETTATQGAALGANVMGFAPVFINSPMTFNQASVLISTPQAGGNLQLAWYTNVNSLPGVLFASTGNITTASATTVTVATSINCPCGPGNGLLGAVFWLAVIYDNTTVRMITRSATASILGSSVYGSSTAANALFASTAGPPGLTLSGQTFGIFPSTVVGQTFSELTSGQTRIPAVVYTVASVP